MPGRDSTPRERFARAVAVISGVWAASAHAAGGHFGVDDAAILDPGTCQVETWWERADHAGSVVHLGPACRVGPVELGINVDRFQPRDGAPQTPAGPQIKWAVALDDRVSVGIAAVAAWQGAAPRYVGATLYVPLTLWVTDTLLLNVNVGADWVREMPARGRAGASLEWTAMPAWTLIAERFRQYGGDFARLGARWQQSRSFALDLSRGGGLGANNVRTWTLGANWTFDAPGATRPPP